MYDSHVDEWDREHSCVTGSIPRLFVDTRNVLRRAAVAAARLRSQPSNALIAAWRFALLLTRKVLLAC